MISDDAILAGLNDMNESIGSLKGDICAINRRMDHALILSINDPKKVFTALALAGLILLGSSTLII